MIEKLKFDNLSLQKSMENEKFNQEEYNKEIERKN